MTDDQALDLARGHVYGFLAAALADPVTSHFEAALAARNQTVAIAAAELVVSEAPEAPELAPAELPPQQLDLRSAIRELAGGREPIERQYLEVFGLVPGRACPPYETEYCRSTLTFYRTQQMADAAGFYHAFGLEQNREQPERQDHISVELEFMAHLIRLELEAPSRAQAAICRDAQKKFLEEHLAWWAPGFAGLLRREAGEGFYAALAPAVASFLASERAVLGVRPPGSVAEPQTKTEAPEEGSCCEALP